MTEYAAEQSGTIGVPSALLAASESLINGLLALDPEGAIALAPLQGRVLRVELMGLGLHLYLVPEAQALRLFGNYDAEPDCLVRATPAALLGMAMAHHREDEVFHGAVSIDGDNGLAQAIGQVFSDLDIDWEEQIAKLVGDGLAQRIGAQARSARQWGARTSSVLNEDLHDYLIEEGRVLPSKPEMQTFLDEVDRLRDDVARLEARLERLQERAP